MTQAGNENERFRNNDRRRYAAAILACLVLLLLYVFFGPDADDIRKRFEFSGAEGPIQLMPELSIDQGDDPKHQDRQKQLEVPPQPAPNYEVVEPDEDGPVETPEAVESEYDADHVFDPESDAEVELVDQVEMTLPTQTNPWFRLVQMVRPRYPADVTDMDRNLEIITVVVAFYVDTDGSIQGSYIISNDGSQGFAQVALKAVNQWRYEPVGGEVAPEGFWNRLTLYFRQPTAALTR